MTATNKQVKKLMKEKEIMGIGKAALRAQMSEKTARKYINAGKLPSELKKERMHRTRVDPFEADWPEIEQQMQVSNGKIEAKTLFASLMERSQRYNKGQLRTLQRHLQEWRCLHGKAKEVIFRQELHPGRQSQSDWTHMKSLGIIIAGKAYPHLLFHFILPYSRHETIMICQTENYDTLSRGFEKAVKEIGGVCAEHRTDNLSAATKAFGKSRVFTEKWTNCLAHYGVKPSRNNPGESHENGSIEKSHDLFKSDVEQQLLLRGSSNFATTEDYEAFLEAIKNRRNATRRERFEEEKATLRGIPSTPYNEVEIVVIKVPPTSLIRIQRNVYSVPSRFIGNQLKAYVYRDNINLRFGTKDVLTLPKIEEGASINYQHIIDSLIRKPGAFKDYQYRECLYPSINFRRAYDVFVENLTNASKVYCELLKLAAMENEHEVECAIGLLLEANQMPTKAAVVDLIAKPKNTEVYVDQPQLDCYNSLLEMEVM